MSLRAVLIAASLFCPLSPARGETPIRLPGNHSLPVYQVAMDALREAYKRIDTQVEFIDYPRNRSLIDANNGEHIDGETMRIVDIEKDFPNLIRVKVPVNEVEFMVVTRKDSFHRKQHLLDFRSHRVGILAGVLVAEKATEGFINLYAVAKPSQLKLMLEKHRIDAVFSTRLIIANWQLDSQEFMIKEPPEAIVPLFHYLSNKHAHLVPKLERALMAMKEENWFHEHRKKLLIRLSRRSKQYHLDQQKSQFFRH